jgi:tetratricopeptide (TPR) repeat protein
MPHTLVLIFFGLTTLYFGAKVLQIAPALLGLLAALLTGRVKWPGPIVDDPDPNASFVREQLGVGHRHLFSNFIFNALGVVGALGFSLLTFASSTLWMRGDVRTNWSWDIVLITLLVLAGTTITSKKAQRLAIQVNTILSDHANKGESQAADGQSAEAKYAIPHPLVGQRHLPSDTKRALDMFYESTRCHQEGHKRRAATLYQQALKVDPSLHENARAALTNMAQDGTSRDQGATYYWLGIHSEYLRDWQQAAPHYEKAIQSFAQSGDQRREARARCNLGNVKMHMNDPSALEEFEQAVALNPQDGIAYINIGTLYYRISERGDPRFERALDAFASAILADPSTYRPIVTSRLRSIGYAWREDLEDINRLVASKQGAPSSGAGGPPGKRDERSRQKSSDLDVPVKKPKAVKTYQDKKHGFEIDIPQNWTIYKEILPVLDAAFLGPGHDWTPDVDVTFTCGPKEFVNVAVETMTPEPTPQMTEQIFRQYAASRHFKNCQYGRITVARQAHTWARYQASDQVWSKKYLIVLSGKGYAITASCTGQKMLSQREKIWDTIATSLRLTPASGST